MNAPDDSPTPNAVDGRRYLQPKRAERAERLASPFKILPSGEAAGPQGDCASGVTTSKDLQVAELEAQARNALHLGVSDACNNSCSFCLNARVDGKIDGAAPRPPTLEETQLVIDRGYAAGMRECWFTVAEPTIGKHIVEAVAYAREVGFEVIGMNTNGRRLGKKALIDRLVDAGLNRLMLSMHGHSAAVHDYIVQRNGAYDQVIEGLERLEQLRDSHDIQLHMLHVLCKPSYPHIADMYAFFKRWARPEKGDKLSYTCLKLLGSTLFDGVFDELGMRYDEMVKEWLRVWYDLGRPPEMLLSEVPGCVVVAQAPPGGPIPTIDVPEHRFTRDGLEQGKTTPNANDVQPMSVVLDEIAITYDDDDNYCKHEGCKSCLVESVCPGIMVEYVKRFGFGEFPPILELPEIVKPSHGGGGGGPLLDDPARLGLLASWLLGLGPAELARLRLVPTGARLDDERFAFTLDGPGGFSLSLFVERRDDAKPAFGRTSRLNLSYKASAEHGFIGQLLKRLARAHRGDGFDDFAEAWGAARDGRTPGGDAPLAAAGGAA
ncbi:MAG: radical SAM protein [Deltaproteobacteria bacterium]|nr:MAG: radical SAM protein [Deltaproteobacteria bacterium]